MTSLYIYLFPSCIHSYVVVHHQWCVPAFTSCGLASKSSAGADFLVDTPVVANMGHSSSIEPQRPVAV